MVLSVTPVPASTSKRSASAKKGWIKRREKAQAQKHLEEQAILALSQEQTRPQQTLVKTQQIQARQTQTLSQAGAQTRSQATGQNTIQITLSPQYKSRQQQRRCASQVVTPDVDVVGDPALCLIRSIAGGDDAAVVAALGYMATNNDSSDHTYDGTVEGVLDINTVDMQGTSALIQAVKSRNKFIVDLLLDVPHVDVNCEDNIQRSAVIWAVYSADTEMMLLLLKKRGDINVDRALIVAASCGYEDMVNLLLTEGGGVVDVNATDHNGNTALLCAIRNNREGTDIEVIVDMLMSKAELDVTITNNYGDSALIQAVRARNYYVVETILCHPSSSYEGGGVDIIGHKDIHGVCAFTWAMHCNCLDIANLVAEQQADRAVETSKPAAAATAAAASGYGKTALTVALVRLLWIQYEEHHADGEDIDADVADIVNNETTCSSQISRKLVAGVPSWSFLKCDRIFNKYITSQLLSRGDLCVNKVDRNGFSALTWAIQHQHDRVVQLLLGRSDVMINRLDNEGQTPLILASRLGHQHYVELLLRRSDIILNAPDPEGKTAMHWAVQNNHASIVVCLIQRPDLDHESFFVTAIENNDDEMVFRLLNNMPSDKKMKGGFLDRMLDFSMSESMRGQSANGNDSLGTSVENNSIVGLLQQECQQRTSAPYIMRSGSDSATTAAAAAADAVSTNTKSEDTGTPRAILCLTVASFIALNYGLNAAYEYWTSSEEAV